LLILVLLIVPSEPGPDLLQVHVLAVQQDLAEDTFIVVIFIILHDDDLACYGIGQVFLLFRAVCLTFLGRIDALEANLVLGIAWAEHDDGVSVRDAHHAAGEGVREYN